jgi:hypothetical protein
MCRQTCAITKCNNSFQHTKKVLPENGAISTETYKKGICAFLRAIKTEYLKTCTECKASRYDRYENFK